MCTDACYTQIEIKIVTGKMKKKKKNPLNTFRYVVSRLVLTLAPDVVANDSVGVFTLKIRFNSDGFQRLSHIIDADGWYFSIP